MRIALFTGFYPPPYNANAVRAMYMVKSLRKFDHDVLVIPLNNIFGAQSFFGEEVFAPHIRGEGSGDQESFYRRTSLFSRAVDLLIRSRKYIDEAISITKKFDPDVVIGTLPPIEALPIAYLSAKKSGACLIADVQDLVDDHRIFERPWLTPAIRLYFRKIYKALKESDLVTSTTEFMRNTLVSRIDHDKVVVVPNGVDNEFYSKCFEKRKEIIRDLAVFLGDLNFKYHRLEVFIEALKIVKAQKTRIRLRVIGEGVLLPKLRSYVETQGLKEYVEFLGYVKREDLPNKLGEGLFGIVGRPNANNPWLLTTLRLTTFEYLSCGLPILAYGPPNSYAQYFIQRHNVGVYVDSDDPEKVSSGIIKILSIIENEPKIIYRCREVAFNYDWNNIMENFVKKIVRYCN